MDRELVQTGKRRKGLRVNRAGLLLEVFGEERTAGEETASEETET